MSYAQTANVYYDPTSSSIAFISAASQSEIQTVEIRKTIERTNHHIFRLSYIQWTVVLFREAISLYFSLHVSCVATIQRCWYNFRALEIAKKSLKSFASNSVSYNVYRGVKIMSFVL